MTDTEKLKRYEAIVKWGTDYIDNVDSWIKDEYKATFSFDRQLLEEYTQSLKELKDQFNKK
jgi:hypothetical protein